MSTAFPALLQWGALHSQWVSADPAPTQTRAGAAQTQHPPTGSAEVAQCSRDVLQKVVVQTCEGAEAYSGQSLGLDCTYWSWGDILELTCYLWRWQGSRRNKHE